MSQLSPEVAEQPPASGPTKSQQVAREELEAPAIGSGVTLSEDKQTFLATWREMVSELYSARELLWQMTLRDIRVRYKQAVMGYAWAILMPILIVGAGLLIKFAVAQLSGQEINTGSISGMAVKSLAWAFTIGAINFSVMSLISNRNLITKIYFPREVFPLSCVLTQLFDTTIGGISVMLIVGLVGGLTLSLSLLWVPVLAALLLMMVAGIAFVLSSANLFFRDVKYIVQVMVTFGIFFTPVFFEPWNFGPTGGTIMMLNPLSALFEGLRLTLIEGNCLLYTHTVTTPQGNTVSVWHPLWLLYSAAWSVALFFGGWWIFHKLEFIYAEYA